MTKSQYRTNLKVISDNLKNAVYLTAAIADDVTSINNRNIDLKHLNQIIDGVGQFSNDFIEIQKIMIEIRTNLEAADDQMGLKL
ncbi:MAG: hypothetical protein KJ774_03205 [Firmicutes bacterium]|nr:hypothetical protein [Bacillota bacterium]